MKKIEFYDKKHPEKTFYYENKKDDPYSKYIITVREMDEYRGCKYALIETTWVEKDDTYTHIVFVEDNETVEDMFDLPFERKCFRGESGYGDSLEEFKCYVDGFIEGKRVAKEEIQNEQRSYRKNEDIHNNGL